MTSLLYKYDKGREIRVIKFKTNSITQITDIPQIISEMFININT